MNDLLEMTATATHHGSNVSPPPALVTVQDLVSLYDQLHVSTLKHPAPVRCRLRKYFGPLLPLPLDALTIPVVLGWVNEIRTHSTTQADSCLTHLRSMINAAIGWGLWKGGNPAGAVKRRRQKPRKRYVLDHEFPGLIKELEREPVFIRLYFYIILFCAPRPGEAEHAKRQHFTIQSNHMALWFRPDTKNQDDQYLPLPYCLPSLLARHLAVLQPHTPWLFPGRKGHCLSKEFWNARWVEIRERCNLRDVQLRDLRRTCATRLLNDDDNPMDLISLSKGVLNHRSLNTTQIYAQPKLERIGRLLDAHMRTALKRAGVTY